MGSGFSEVLKTTDFIDVVSSPSLCWALSDEATPMLARIIKITKSFLALSSPSVNIPAAKAKYADRE